ncbi:hypothetical protein G6F43_005147 [Rhizopus delemar]|nr:hypothetical protein G6F43_005147 [Rhizopus delemar]
MVYLKLITTLSVAILWQVSADVESISECPKLAPRTSAAKDVTDLRIDDIEVVAALGDSAMAGFAMMGVAKREETPGVIEFDFDFVREFRGNSYGIGGDDGAVTLANFIKYYNSNVSGASTSSHLVSLCYGPFCVPYLSRYRPVKDNFNAAQYGAIAMNLNYELDYLIPRMKSQFSSPEQYSTAWKMITLQIGSNDQCSSCNTVFSPFIHPDNYEMHIENAIQRIQKEIPRTVVHLLKNFKISDVYQRTQNETEYCKARLVSSRKFECDCFDTPDSVAGMDTYYDAYNKKLEAIAAKYSAEPGGTFAVMYSPSEVDVLSFPIDCFSNTDCFHPSLKAHQWLAKSYWNQLFFEASLKPPVMKFDPDLKIRCPTEQDRLHTTFTLL